LHLYIYLSLLALDADGGATIALRLHFRGDVARRDSDVDHLVVVVQLDGVRVSVVVNELDLVDSIVNVD
jgi:hypothetical protein